MQYKNLYEFIKDMLPIVDGYGMAGIEFNKDGESNHNVFQQSIRESQEGDVGIFVVSTVENHDMKFITLEQTEVQVMVNCVNGDISGAIDFLNKTYRSIKDIKEKGNLQLFNTKLLNIRPVGKNTSGIQFCVLNMLLKYKYN